jgi:hypothetical protein
MTVAMGKSIATFREEAKKVLPLRIDVVEVQVADQRSYPQRHPPASSTSSPLTL